MTNCSFDICIYNKDCRCTLTEVCINGAGHCDNCIIPVIPGRVLDEYKDKLLKYLAAQEKALEKPKSTKPNCT